MGIVTINGDFSPFFEFLGVRRGVCDSPLGLCGQKNTLKSGWDASTMTLLSRGSSKSQNVAADGREKLQQVSSAARSRAAALSLLAHDKKIL